MGLDDRHYARPGYGGSGSGMGGGGRGFSGFDRFGSAPRSWSANTWIIVICTAVFVIDSLLGSSGVMVQTEIGRRTVQGADGSMRVISDTADWPVLQSWFHFSTAKALFGLEIWRFVGFQFLHGSFQHLLFNMIGLFFFGGLVEQYLGKKRYVAYYLLTGVCGALFYMLLNLLGNMNVPLPGVLHYDIWTPLIGASAGVFGVLMAAAYLAPNAKVLLFFIVPMRLSTLIYVLVGIAAFTLLTSGSNAGGEAAHLGGAFAGFWFIRRPTRIWRVVELVFGKGRKPGQARVKKPKAGRGQPSDEDLDRILAKVAMEGLHSLTEKERKVLRRATDSRRG